MENKKFIKKYNITKKTAILILFQMVLLTCALVISLFGIFKSLDLVNNLNRIIIYGVQALICCITILFGIYYFNKTNTKYFKIIIMSYALLETLRVSLLQTNGITEIYGFLSKFILVLLALDAALLSERTERKEGLYLSLTMVGLETILYIIFLVGFPAVRTRLLYMIVPLVGILMAGSMCIFITGKLEQKNLLKEK